MWWVAAGAVAVVLVVAVSLIGRRSNDLGSVSSSWISQHQSDSR